MKQSLTAKYFRNFLVGSVLLLTSIEGAAMNPPAAEKAPSAGLFDAFNGFESLSSGEVIWMGGFERNALSKALFDLVQYMRNNVSKLSPEEVLAQVPKYNRLEMFGTWVNEDGPANCYNTRAEVLIRDAKNGAKVKFSSSNPCQVIRADWVDPYTGEDFKQANAVQVDHVVPLKNAYRSGAHAWTRERRCHYGNFLQDERHLLTVSGRENMSKADKGPEKYLPPSDDYICAYLANWMRIKAVWNLQFSREEQMAIEGNLASHGCKTTDTSIALKEILATRMNSNEMNPKCSYAETHSMQTEYGY